MIPWRLCLPLAVAVLAQAPGGYARAEAPPAPAPAPASPASAPARAGGGPASPAKGPAVILSALPPMSGVFGGKVEFADKAFPILVEYNDTAVQSAIRGTTPLPCQACNGKGKVGKRQLIAPPEGVMGKPVLQTWEDDCQVCGTYKDMYDPRIGQRLLVVVDRLGHVPRGEKFDELRQAASQCLEVANVVRDKTLTTFRAKPVIRTETRTHASSSVSGSTTTFRTMAGATTEPDQQKQFHVEIAPQIEAIWTRVGPQPPVGQAVIIIGTTGDKAEAGGWVWMRIKPNIKDSEKPNSKGPGPEAIVLCGPPQANVVPEGRVVIGGLMVGRWTPEGGAPAAAPPAAPGAPAAEPRVPALPAGSLPPGSLPVILAVAATVGK